MSRGKLTMNTDIWVWPPVVAPEVPADEDPLLFAFECAELIGISSRTWRKYAQYGVAPPPDDLDEARPFSRRMPRWRKSRVEFFMRNRIGRGSRADLIRAQRESAS